MLGVRADGDTMPLGYPVGPGTETEAAHGAYDLRLWALEAALVPLQVKRPVLQDRGGAHTCNFLQSVVCTLGSPAAEKHGPPECGLGTEQPCKWGVELG